MPSAESHDIYNLKLSDKLNLTGRVKRPGTHAAISGGCANVWEGEFEGEKVAVKVVREVGTRSSKERLQKRLVREVRAWSKLHHRNVLNLLGFTYGFDTSSTLASLVSPWMPKGTATKYLEKRSTTDRVRVLTGVADGLCYLHRHDVVHGDLKGDNILIDERGEPRLADFGLSKLMTEIQRPGIQTITGALPGSVRWMARELIDATDVASVTCESDVWAFGMTILELFTSLPPFHHLWNDPQVIIHIHKGVLPDRPVVSTGLDDELWSLCLKCWVANPQLRPSTRVIAKSLWEVDLKCKLKSRTKRRLRDPESPDSDQGRLASCEERLRKSPKLSTLAELSSDECPSPGSPLSSSRALVRTPTPRSSSMSSSATPSSGSLSDSSRRSSMGDFTEMDPRHFFTNSHSDGDLYAHLHRHHERAAVRGYSESSVPIAGANSAPHLYRASHPHHPHRSSGLGLEIVPYADLDAFDESSALVSPGQSNLHGNFDLGAGPSTNSPRQPIQPLQINPYDAFHYAQGSPRHSYPPHLPPLSLPATNSEGTGQTHSYLSEQFLQDPYDPMHPSQWQTYPYIGHAGADNYFHSRASRSYPEGIDLTPSSYADFLNLPTPPAGESYTDGHSPQESMLSPHQIGPIFSDTFISEPLSYDDPICVGDSRTPPTVRPNIDFESYRQGVISPALSDATPTAYIRDVMTPAGLANPMDSPLIPDGPTSFDSFDDDLGSDNYSLFGGLAVADGFANFDEEPALFAQPNYHAATPTNRTPRQSPGSKFLDLPTDTITQLPLTPGLSPLLSSF